MRAAIFLLVVVPVILSVRDTGIYLSLPGSEHYFRDAWALDTFLVKNEGVLTRRYPNAQTGPIEIMMDASVFPDRIKPVRYILERHGYTYGIYIMIHDQPISNVLVNGRRFFSDCPEQATANLPPDSLNGIFISDSTLGDQSDFRAKPPRSNR